MKNIFDKFKNNSAIEIIIVLAIAILIVLGAFWLLWSLWSFVMGEIWPDGPEALVNPGYWLFIGEWMVAGFVGRRIFGR